MPETKPPDAITAITVKGFKSFADETRLEIRPLTLLAGANSSGKSSALQPILLLKQTLEASYDPGPLLLSGSHARFSLADQILNHRSGRRSTEEFRAGLETAEGKGFSNIYRRKSNESFDLIQTDFLGRVSLVNSWLSPGDDEPWLSQISLRPVMSDQELSALVPGDYLGTLYVGRNRCFLQVAVDEAWNQSSLAVTPIGAFSSLLLGIIHVPGLRGNPTRAYGTTAVGERFVGTFENYAASIIARWQQERDERSRHLGRAMEALGLSWKVEAKAIDATQVELLVGRLPKGRSGGARDMVNVADVGFGVSQVLPVLVALLAAEPGQLVYLEQPELHLHPRAQEALADILAEASNRGVQIVAETHSSILLLTVQALVAEGKLDPSNVKLHWFQRGADGVTKVQSGDLDSQGAYGDWPEDFGEVRARAENRYLDAVEAKVFPPKKPKRNAKAR